MTIYERFIQDCCQKGDDFGASYSDLFKEFSTWLESKGFHKIRSRVFASELKNFGFKHIRTRSGMIILGLELKGNPIS